ncbi:MAG: Carbonic anhydrase [Bryobacterales bacterium]|nr:Carbonic anhydrase [Bryobacterales bacterium]
MTSQFDAKNDATKCKQTSPSSQSSSTRGPQPSVSNEDASRRNFLQMAVGGAAAVLATAAGMEFAAPSAALAQSLLTPEQALKELQDGNKRFVAGNLTSFDQDLAILRNHTSEKQQPFAAVLACSDSRVPVELIFDQTIGHIFVTRVAGNFTTSEIIASLEYGAAVLGTKVILVMGHGSCGAVEATIQHKDVPGQISALYPHIQPAVDKVGTDTDTVSKANALIQAALLRQSSTALSSLVDTGKLKVLAAFYNIASGVVSLLE